MANPASANRPASLNRRKIPKMKTFDDLNFAPHPSEPDAVRARLALGGGLVASVMANKKRKPFSLYGSVEENLWEVAILQAGRQLPISIFDTVAGWQTPEQINYFFRLAQTRPDWPVELWNKAEAHKREFA